MSMNDYATILLHAKQMIRAIKLVNRQANFDVNIFTPAELRLCLVDGMASVSIFVPEDVNTANYSYVESMYGITYDHDTQIMTLKYKID